MCIFIRLCITQIYWQLFDFVKDFAVIEGCIKPLFVSGIYGLWWLTLIWAHFFKSIYPSRRFKKNFTLEINKLVFRNLSLNGFQYSVKLMYHTSNGKLRVKYFKWLFKFDHGMLVSVIHRNTLSCITFSQNTHWIVKQFHNCLKVCLL